MKFIKTIGISILVIGGALFSATFLTKNQSGEIAGIVDRFNPFVPKGAVYVRSTEPKSVNGYGTANYVQKAVDENGHVREIDFNAIQEMSQGILVKITNKGAYVETIEKVSEENIPAAALQKLKEISE